MQKGETATDALHSSCDRHIKEENIMNYATAQELPDWTAKVQSYSQKIIRHTPIVLKAFGKTIARVTIASIKGFSNHWFESECYWRQRITNLAGISYNPLTASISAARAELTSEEAIATYRRLQHIATETAMVSVAIAAYGVFAIAQGVKVAQKVYRTVKRCYDWVDARLNPPLPEPSILPTVTQFFAQDKAEEDIAVLIEAVGHERSFLIQFDRLDAEALATIQAKADEAIAGAVQAKANQCKCDRAALVLQMEGDRLAREAFASVVDRAVAYATAETVQRMLQATTAPAVTEAELVGSLDVPGATGKRTSRAKSSTSKTGATPKEARAKAKV
jgi:hypothetical protein